MTINTLEQQRPHFPPDLRCRIAEMVKETSSYTEESAGSSPLDIFLPKIHYVDEGLALFFRALSVFNAQSVTRNAVNDGLIYLRTMHRLIDPDTDPALKVAIQALNVKRTGFADQFYRKGILVEEYINAVRTLYLDLPDIIQASRYFAASVIHPVLDDSAELLDETKENLNRISAVGFHRHFDLHCHQLRQSGATSSLLPAFEETIIPTSAGEVCWPTSYLYRDPIREIYEYLPEVMAEGVEQVKSQFLSLRYVRVNDTEILQFQRDNHPALLTAWSRLAEQIRLLLFLMDLHLDVQESAMQVQWQHLFTQLRHEEDPALHMVVLTKLKHLLHERVENG